MHGPGVDEPLVWYECANPPGACTSNTNWLIADRQGSIIATTDGSGAATLYRYGPYGEPEGGGWTGSRFRYTGQIALPELRLYHYKARVYDPGLGRFLQTDPVGYDDDLNLYQYVGNDPLNRSVPTGRQEERTRGYNPLLVFVPGSPENDHFVGTWMYLLGQCHNSSACQQTYPGAVFNESAPEAPGLPEGIVGEDPRETRGRTNSGPLAEEHGGTGDPQGDFDVLTGGRSGPAPEGSTLPPGTQVGENGIQIRPGTDTTGPRIDIPASGDKPRETLHYPRPPPPPEERR